MSTHQVQVPALRPCGAREKWRSTTPQPCRAGHGNQTGVEVPVVALLEAQVLVERWRNHYNQVRPHSALGYRPPAPETIVQMDQTPVMH